MISKWAAIVPLYGSIHSQRTKRRRSSCTRPCKRRVVLCGMRPRHRSFWFCGLVPHSLLISLWFGKVGVVTRVMNDLSNEVVRDHRNWTCKPIPTLAIYILLPLFFIGLSVSTFIFIAVHNAIFFVSFLLLSALVAFFVAWNRLKWRRKAAVFSFLHSFPDSDLSAAREGKLVKITGVASCGDFALQSSYEQATRCIYTSTLLYENGGFRLKPRNIDKSCFKQSLVYCERFSTDFYITDRKSGVRAMVKAGYGCKVVPLIVESKLVTTTKQCRTLSAHLRKWLQERNLSAEARVLSLEEGYVQEGSTVTVMGMLQRNNDILMIVQPPELLSTGCLWQNFLISVDVEGLVFAVPNRAGPILNPGFRQQPEQ